jgi:16S rRNA processing protein RimM
LIGKINGLFGVQGWVKIFSYSDPRKNILTYQPWHIQVNGQWQTLEKTTGRVQGKTIVAQLKNITNREQAHSYIGTDIYIEKSQLPALSKGEYYWEELIGLTVINQENITLGVVNNLMDTGANTVLVVQGEQEYLIPYIKPFLLQVELQNKQITVDWDADF